MLILARNPGQQIHIEDDIIIRVLDIKGKQVTIGIEAPKSVSVDREEIYIRKKASALQKTSRHASNEDKDGPPFFE